MNKAFYIASIVALASVSWGQDLNTTTIRDQFNSGNRGNAAGSVGTSKASLQDGTEFAAYSGADSTGGPINYINAYAGVTVGDTTHGETPVVTVTSAMTFADRNLAAHSPAIAANTRPGATGGATAVQIADDGGQNVLGFGQNDDTDYYVQADVYCWDNSAATGTGTPIFEVAQVAARTFRDSVPQHASGSYSIDRDGGYAIVYGYQAKKFYCLKWLPGATVANIAQQPPAAAAATIFHTIDNVTTGWHTLRVSCLASHITYSVDGTVVHTATDSAITSGRGALGYRERNVTDSMERPALFDNLVAGPSNVAAVSDWQLY